LGQANRKPLYQPWNEEAFRADLQVGAMLPIQRWMYRTLLQSAFFHSTRPFLPDDDAQLWLLAGCENRKQWDRHKDVVRGMFAQIEIDGERLLSRRRLLADWERIEEKRRALAEAGSKGGRAKAKPEPSKCLSNAEPEVASAKQEKLREVEEEKEEKVKTAAAPAEPAQTRRATPLLDGFQLDAEMILFANEHGADPIGEFDAFTDCHKSRGNKFKDWKAAWRNWIRNSQKFGRGGRGNGMQQNAKSAGSKFSRTLEAAQRVWGTNQGVDSEVCTQRTPGT